MAGAITGLVLAGENVTRTGSGTLADPYVISAPAPLPPARGEPVPLTVLAPAASASGITVTRNPEGSATLGGSIQITGPVTEDSLHFANLPTGYAPADAGGFIAVGFMGSPSAQYVIQVDINPGAGQLFANIPDVPDGSVLFVTLDSVVFWPAP